MKIVSLVENSSNCGLRTAHGLALYIESEGHKILFDLGGDDTILYNAASLGVDLTEIDTVIISHGHKDHGGALALFLDLNHKAKIYIQRGAFLPHFSHRATGFSNISLDSQLMDHPQVVLLDGDFKIDNGLQLFTLCNGERRCWSSANNSLYEGEELDSFRHEQNLLISQGDGSSTLIMGCGHNGVVNIMARAAELGRIDRCVGGFHLTSPSADRDEPYELLDRVIEELREYEGCEFHTCHCTGERVYEYMSREIKSLNYLRCGESVED